MKRGILFAFCALLIIIQSSHAQQWQLFTGPDAVTDFKLYHDKVWVISGSGLTRIDINTGDKTNWNLINSDIQDYAYDVMAIDSAGTVWLGGYGKPQILHFDGTNWEHLTNINGLLIGSVSDIQVTPDGKVWFYGDFENESVFFYENHQFYPVAAPSPDWIFGTGTDATIGYGLNNHVWFNFHNEDYTLFLLGEFNGSQWYLHDLSAYTTYLSPSDKWIGDLNGNFYMLPGTGPGNQILKYDGFTWQSISMPAGINDYLNQDRPLYLDDQNRIWLAIENNTFLRFDGQQWETIGLNTFGLNGGWADGLFIDHDNTYWIFYSKDVWGLNSDYLYKSDGQTSTQIDLSNSPLPTNSLSSVFIDPQNNKWINAKLSMVKYNGVTWKNLPLNDYAPAAIGHDGNGGVWLDSYGSSLWLLDNVTLSKIPITKPGGIPYDNIYDATVSNTGIVYVASRDSFILVFDHGTTSYLGGMKFTLFGQPNQTDFSEFVALDTAGRIYSMGFNSIHRLEDNLSWTNIPLWSEFPESTNRFMIAPNGDIWVPFGLSLPGGDDRFMIYHEGEWAELDEPVDIHSLPHWDQEGNLWMKTDQGLCKKMNSEWVCYNETNSPIPVQLIRDFEIDQYDNIWITLQDGGLMLFNENQINHIEGHDLPFVTGNIYRDLNHNETLDTTDTPMALHRALLLPDSTVTFTNPEGLYRFTLLPGEHSIQYEPADNWHIDNSPPAYQFQISTDSLSGFDFRIAPDQEKVDLRFFLSEGYPRCNSEASYSLSYSNYGTQSESGRTFMVLDPQVTFYNSYPMPSAVSGDTVFWTFNNLLPSALVQVYMVLGMPGFENDTLTLKSYLDRWNNGQYERVDSIITDQEILCSFDPNDKIGKSPTTRADGSGSLFDPIRYTIRFQNTGNDTAFNIVILDTLDINLDPSTFFFQGSSHPCEILIRQERIVEFRFLNISLPDSNRNEAKSHGFISYSIKPKLNLPSPTMIQNRASIHFDFNDAIQTNTITNTLIDPTLAIKEPSLQDSWFKVYPSPASDEILLELDKVVTTSLPFVLLNENGKQISTGNIRPGELKHLNISTLPGGMYILQVIGEARSSAISFVKR